MGRTGNEPQDAEVVELLEAFKQKYDLKSDAALADFLQTSKNTVYRWKVANFPPPLRVLFTLLTK